MWILFVVMKMKKANCIRIFFACCLVSGCLGLYLKYQLPAWKNGTLTDTEESNYIVQEQETQTDLPSANMDVTYQYIMVAEDGYLTVYLADTQTLYMYTDIRYERLPEKLQKKISQGMKFETLEELYDFLENYSS